MLNNGAKIMKKNWFIGNASHSLHPSEEIFFSVKVLFMQFVHTC